MDELIRVLIEDPSLLSDFKPEYAQDLDMVLISVMSDLQKQGIKPTYEVLKHQLPQIKFGEKTLGSLVPHLNARMNVELKVDPFYVIQCVKNDYNQRTLFTMLNEGMRKNNTDSVENTVQFLVDSLKTITLGSRSKTMQGATDQAMEFLERVWDGTVVSHWVTGHARWDKAIATSRRQLLMVAANHKQGKSSKVLDKVMRLNARQSQLSFIWFTFEMHTTELVISMIAWLTGIPPRIINGKERLPNEEERTKIRVAKQMIHEMPITFFDQKMNMDTIRRNVDRKMTNDCVVVIDNLGLVQSSKDDSVSSDNEIANALVDMRDNTDAHIVALHHMSKSIEHYTNKPMGYAPQVHHIRGSNKWMDSVNILVLLHRIEMYKELMDEFSAEQREKVRNKMQVTIPLVRDGQGQADIMNICNMGLCQFEETDEESFY